MQVTIESVLSNTAPYLVRVMFTLRIRCTAHGYTPGWMAGDEFANGFTILVWVQFSRHNIWLQPKFK